jgi:hypothetical protein
MQVIKAPFTFEDAPRPWVFLAGSIEMGAAVDWQSVVTTKLSDLPGTLLNPRRDDWDSSWRQSLDSPNFVEQVEWELVAQNTADLILMYFDPATKSPITLLEFGMFARTGNLLVCCPEGFWRKGNVDVTARWCDVPTFATLDRLVEAARADWPSYRNP